MSKLHMGMTKAEVSSSIGTPGSRYYHSGNEVWVYYYNMVGQVYAGAITTMSCFSILFDGDRTAFWHDGCAPEPSNLKSIYRELNGTVSVGVEQSKWLVSFSPGAMKYAQGTLPGYFSWKQGANILSIIIEPAPKGANAIACRDRSLARIKEADPDSHGHKSWENGESAFSEFVSERGGEKRLHLNRHIVKDGFWYDIHFSKGDPGNEDESKVIVFLESIQLVQR
jgi:hypothetical protein